MEILRWDVGDAAVIRVGELDATSALEGLIPDLDRADVSRASWLTPRYIDETGRLKGSVQAFVVFIAGKVIGLDGKPNAQLAFLDQSFVDKKIAEFFLRIVDAEANPACLHDTRVADLTAHFGIER
jgi:hypothetical protein